MTSMSQLRSSLRNSVALPSTNEIKFSSCGTSDLVFGSSVSHNQRFVSRTCDLGLLGLIKVPFSNELVGLVPSISLISAGVRISLEIRRLIKIHSLSSEFIFAIRDSQRYYQ